MVGETERIGKISISNEKVQQLYQRCISEYEEVLRILARNLHDGIGQNLVTVKLVLGSTLAELPVEQAGLRQKLTLAINNLDQAIESVRSLLDDFRPSTFEIMGLNLTLLNYCHEFSGRNHLPVEYTGEEIQSLPDPIAISFYRFAQESLKNIVKHAQAQEAHVCLGYQDGFVTLSVEDDGIGFDPAVLPDGTGLFGLKERFEILGGKIEITTKPGQGTCLKAQIPIHDLKQSYGQTIMTVKAAQNITPIRAAVVDDHQSTMDGYLFRLGNLPNIQVVGMANYGEEIEDMVDGCTPDVLLLDLHVPVSRENHNPFPVMNLIYPLIQKHPDLNILVISMFSQPFLINTVVEAGVSGYIFKDDYESIRDLPRIVTTIAHGGIHFSEGAYKALRTVMKDDLDPLLTPRQIEILSICAAYLDNSTSDLAKKLGIAGSTFRNLLSNAYVRLGVRSKAAAITKAKKLGLIISPENFTDFSDENKEQ